MDRSKHEKASAPVYLLPAQLGGSQSVCFPFRRPGLSTPLSSHWKDFKNGIHSFCPALCNRTNEVMRRMKYVNDFIQFEMILLIKECDKAE